MENGSEHGSTGSHNSSHGESGAAVAPASTTIYEYNATFIAPSETICSAAPAEENASSQFASFNPNQIENTIKQYNEIKVTYGKDALGRNFYYFDDAGFKPLVLVLFDTPSDTLLTVNESVMPLSEFMSITHVKQENELESSEKPPSNIREINAGWKAGSYGTVVCTTSDETSIVIPNTNVKLIMMALAILSEKYDDVTDSDEESDYQSDEESDEECADQSDEVQAPEHIGIIRRILRWLW